VISIHHSTLSDDAPTDRLISRLVELENEIFEYFNVEDKPVINVIDEIINQKVLHKKNY